MSFKERIISQKLASASKTFPVIVITGARQVGKTTLLKEMYGKEFDYVVFDPIIDIENARTDPSLFFNSHKTPLILDEIQYAPEIVSTLKRVVDNNRMPGQFFLTGSQQWSVMRALCESLAGRAAILEMDGFSLAELSSRVEKTWLSDWLDSNDSFDLRAYKPFPLTGGTFGQIWKGWLPEAQIMPLENVPLFYQSYQRTYIEKDIRLLSDVSDWQLFGRFVRLIAALSAQEINYSQIGREIGIAPQTARRWMETLTATFQWVEVPAFSTNSIKKISEKPKGFLTDTGMLCCLQAIATPQVLGGHPLFGAIFETAVVNELRKQSQMLKIMPNFFHWRSHSGAEVDLVLEFNGKYFPIEIKGKTHVTKADTSGLQAFRSAYPHLPIARGLVVCTCESPYILNQDGDIALPWNL
ncbi:MAG: GTP-binding protein [Verrucomicrobia bacterium GWF2_51_19]|nr:MAG: GTP-binding protein [Verrucomicrobia bacterium GWF2_51_19]HCJ12154.1 GTP-binding protein [Opitutae bacterium]